ncbi:ABC transporter permease [Ornithinicoccus hortensis]|uniref:ABC-2 type transport system permease protein n=1 Tax=Ornithinicoccus hortensis TaxID=82346 RepID=A0A542YWH1_9MICO|nr:ABC transporter permease [Ornithinicoccus hortensis]TQL52448.1 ABC-2 type transport system permease protein [Ornithinicoccus hortensis]
MTTLADTRAPSATQERTPLWRPFRIHAELDLKDFWRSPIQLAFIVAMPVMFYVIFGFAMRDGAAAEVTHGANTLTQANLSFAGVLVFALLSVVLANVAISLAIKRHHGLFKRFRTTPVSPVSVMGGFLVNTLVSMFIVFGAVTAIGVLGLGVQLPTDRLLTLGAVSLLGFLAIAPLGVALSLVPPNADSAVPLVNAVFFPVAFMSGAFVAIPFPGPVQQVIDLLPGKPLMDLFTPALAGTGPVWDSGAALVLVAWGIFGTAASVAFFSWASESEPRTFSRLRATGEES